MRVEVDYKNCDPERLAKLLWKNVLTGTEDSKYRQELLRYYKHCTVKELWDKCETLCHGKIYEELGVTLKTHEYKKPVPAPKVVITTTAKYVRETVDIAHNIKCELYRKDLADIVLHDEILYVKTRNKEACERIIKKHGYLGEVAWTS
jgi:hypothetical protein